ncbi:hypothetical protein LTS18_009662, partial [Coniosporium uncinatum]
WLIKSGSILFIASLAWFSVNMHRHRSSGKPMAALGSSGRAFRKDEANALEKLESGKPESQPLHMHDTSYQPHQQGQSAYSDTQNQQMPRQYQQVSQQTPLPPTTAYNQNMPQQQFHHTSALTQQAQQQPGQGHFQQQPVYAGASNTSGNPAPQHQQTAYQAPQQAAHEMSSYGQH